MKKSSILSKILRIAGMAVSVIYVLLLVPFIFKLQSSNSNNAEFYFALGMVAFVVITYPLIFVGFLERYRPWPIICLAVASMVVYPIIDVLTIGMIDLEGILAALFFTFPAILYVIGWSMNRSQQPTEDPSAPEEPQPIVEGNTMHERVDGCKNCDPPMGEKEHYCWYCGQSHRDYGRNVFYLAGEVITDYLDWVLRLLRTLLGLLLPGYLSKQFVLNHRARFTSPRNLYAVSSFLFIFFLTWYAESLETEASTSPPPEMAVQETTDTGSMTHPQGGAKDVLWDEPKGLPFDESAEQDHATVVPDTGAMTDPQGEVEDVLGGEPKGLPLDGSSEQDHATATPDENGSVDQDALMVNMNKLGQVPINLWGIIKDVLGRFTDTESERFKQIDLELEQTVDKGIDTVLKESSIAEQTLFGLLSSILLLVQLFFALWLKIVYFNKNRSYAQHLVFSVHIHCMALIGFTAIIIVVMDTAFADHRTWIVPFIALAMVSYLLLALGNFYDEDVGILAIIKATLLMAVYVPLSLTFLLGAVLAMPLVMLLPI